MKLSQNLGVRVALYLSLFLSSPASDSLLAQEQEAMTKKLVTAAARGNLDVLKELLAEGVDIDSRSRIGITALGAARIHGSQAAVKFLLARGADSKTCMPPPEEQVDTFLKILTRGRSPGIGVLVSRNGKILFEKGYGYANIEKRERFTPGTRSRIGSVTKQFTATAILRLKEQGKLSLEDTLSKFIPDYPRGDEVTLAHLLTHTSGIHSYTSKPDFMKRVTKPIKPEDLIESFRKDPFDFSPGQNWSYCNSGYFLLGHIVASVSGESYADHLRKHLLKPAGMENTGVHTRTAAIEQEAMGYSFKDGKFERATDWDMSHAGGAGSLYSTVRDLHRWNEAVFGGKILDDASLKAAFTPVKVKKRTGGPSYGYGWMMSEFRGLRTIGHGGGLHGFLTQLTRYPDQKFTVVVFANCSPPKPRRTPGSLAKWIAQRYLWQEMKPRAEYVVDKGVNPKTYDALVGRYDFGRAILTVSRKGNRLFAKLAGQPACEIFPRSETEFFLKVVDARITFIKNKKGEVGHAIHRQNGRTTRALRLKDQVVARVDPAVFDAYVGKYDYGSGRVLSVTRKGDRLFARLTGQQKLELLPSSETAFFWKDVNARITFVKNAKGDVVKGIHNQHGQVMEAPRIE